jgi:DNA mismatch endonuclease, patch repair protein
MADTFSKQKRSQIMAAVKSKENKATELKLISVFRANKIAGWRRNHKIKGKPDFIFRKERIALFVDGCFWHGCPIHCRKPHSNRRYWLRKIVRNQKRDIAVRKKLRETGWRVLRIWEHELRLPSALVKRIKSKLSAGRE